MDEELAWHRRHDHNTGKEEHRLARLLNPERKLREIREYINILGLFDSQSIMQTTEGYRAMKHKETIMKELKVKMTNARCVSQYMRFASQNAICILRSCDV